MKITYKTDKIHLKTSDCCHDITNTNQNNQQKFEYFPTSYRMSTVSKQPQTKGNLSAFKHNSELNFHF